jgi:hypothetical protein
MIDLKQDEDKKRACEDVMAIVETPYQISKLTYYLSCIAINFSQDGILGGHRILKSYANEYGNNILRELQNLLMALSKL